MSDRNIPLPGVMETVGPFFNVLPCRLRVELDIPPLELLRPNQAAMHSRLENQNCSLLDIIRCTGLELDGLLNTCLTVQPALSSSFSTQSEQTDGGLELQEYDDPTEVGLTLSYHKPLQFLHRKHLCLSLTPASSPFVVLFWPPLERWKSTYAIPIPSAQWRMRSKYRTILLCSARKIP